jgi:hypothetical protein
MATCKKCGKPIDWKRDSGKWIPLDVQHAGRVHFEFCKPNRVLETRSYGFTGKGVKPAPSGGKLPWED